MLGVLAVTQVKSHTLVNWDQKGGLDRELNPGPRAPEARIIPLDHQARHGYGGGSQGKLIIEWELFVIVKMQAKSRTSRLVWAQGLHPLNNFSIRGEATRWNGYLWSLMHVTPWRNGSASDSRSEGCVFKSRRGHSFSPSNLLFDEFFMYELILTSLSTTGNATVAEWLRRLTRNQIPFGSAGSNPAGCDIF